MIDAGNKTKQWEIKMTNVKSLLKLAQDINEAGNNMCQYQIQFGELLLEAKKRVVRETNQTFREWCRNYIFKKNAQPYSYKTIENAMWLARDPLAAQRDRLKRAVRDRKRRLRKHKTSAEFFISLGGKNLSEDEQINLLMTAWEKTSDIAHDRFLELVNIKPINYFKKQSRLSRMA